MARALTTRVSGVSQSQRTVMQEQDDGLDRLSAIVQRQKMIAKSIGQELGLFLFFINNISCRHCKLTGLFAEEQNSMLDDLDTRVERTNINMSSTTKKVMKLL